MAIMLAKTVLTAITTDTAGNTVEAVPVFDASSDAADIMGRPVDPVELVEDENGVRVRYVETKAVQDTAGNWIDATPVTGGGAPAWVPTGASYFADFVEGLYWNGAGVDQATALSGTGGTPGTAFEADGDLVDINAPRITDLGLLVEAATVQICGFSYTIADANWTKENVTVGSRIANFTSLLMTSATGFHRISKGAFHGVTIGDTVTGSMTIKALGGQRYGCIRSSFVSGNVNVGFDLDSVAITRTPAGHTNCQITRIDDTYRIQFTCVAGITGSPNLQLFMANAAVVDDTAPSFVGDITKGFAVGNVDIVAGSVMRSPVLRASSTGVTKTADAVVLKLPSGGPFDLTFAFDDDSTQTVTDVPGGDYAVPTNLNRPLVKSAVWGAV